MSKPRSPTAKTLAVCRNLGGFPFIVEHWHCHAKIRQDLLGMFDVLWLDIQKKRIVGIQTSSYTHHAERVRKLKANLNLEPWKRCGGHAEVWTWKPDETEHPRVTVL